MHLSTILLFMKVLTYHNIEKPPEGAKLKTLYVKPSKFERQLKALRWLGFKTSLTPDSKNDKEVLLTFDDGYKDFIENALPLLEKYNFTAVVFVVAGLVGTFNVWDHEKLRVKKTLMDWKDLEYIVKRGIKLGSHTLTHPYLTKLDLKEAKKEIEGSKKILEDKLGVEIDYFCYPYGDYNKQVKELVKEAGYKYAFSTKLGTFKENNDPYEIPRITVFGNIILPKFILQLIL